MTWKPELQPNAAADDRTKMEWLVRSFRKLSQWSENVQLQQLGHGALQRINSISLGNIAAGAWVTVPFEQGSQATPINFLEDPANNEFAYEADGTWQFDFYMVFLCAKNATTDRILFARLFDVTAGVPLTTVPFPIPVENNSNFGSFSVPGVLFEIPDTTVGNRIRVEIGGAALVFNTVSIEKAGISANRLAHP